MGTVKEREKSRLSQGFWLGPCRRWWGYSPMKGVQEKGTELFRRIRRHLDLDA